MGLTVSLVRVSDAPRLRAANDQSAESPLPQENPSMAIKTSKRPNHRTVGSVAAVAAVAMVGGLFIVTAEAQEAARRDAAMLREAPSSHPRGKPDAEIPRPGMDLVSDRVALVITDPQNDFLHPDGVAWGVVGKSVTENGVVEHLEQLFRAAHASRVPVFISPHYYFPHDHGWRFEGALEKLMHDIGMFDRPGPLDVSGFEGSGADWLERYKPLIDHSNCTVVSPHKIYGPETNDLVMQLRKRGVDQVILAGMSANLCTESHMRELIEQGFEVVVVSDATAGAILPEYNTYEAAYINFRFIASDVWTTDAAVQRMRDLR